MTRHSVRTVKVRLPVGIVNKIDQLVSDEFFLDREDFIRYSVYYKLDFEVADADI